MLEISIGSMRSSRHRSQYIIQYLFQIFKIKMLFFKNFCLSTKQTLKCPVSMVISAANINYFTVFPLRSQAFLKLYPKVSNQIFPNTFCIFCRPPRMIFHTIIYPSLPMLFNQVTELCRKLRGVLFSLIEKFSKTIQNLNVVI